MAERSKADRKASGNGKVKVAAVGDLHVQEDAQTSYRDLFGEVSREADILVLTGDLTNLGKPKEAELLAEDLRACSIPVVAVLGNHDYESGCVDQIAATLRQAGVYLLDGQATELMDVGFVGVKGFVGGFGSRMLGSFGEPAIKAMVAESVNEAMRLENAMRQVRAKRTLVVLHYAPIPETVAGEPPEIFPFLGSSRLAETIDRFKVSAVVHGHAHRGSYEGQTPGGAKVYNVAMHITKPTGRPYALLEI
ncbi:metallophosphoesterase [Mesorhizobium sp. B3-1-9]|uniref:metallophosphoesterase family protein n=1 Tax=unclassified Mesorhizobium TaxID=325217 RepID=UPI00112A4913|nr:MULTISPECIES: metallophosphoesterase [unclassified Mesorhizobium]TPI38215.1 metallophosphoesterase [Mesorhizobium sp. B3-1-9]TPI44431.1 metallophosphoesterase [Mesorhizobium sp. B3-1-6]UCI28499.1 metallophosphoesterase [Mesorhizobium sp. B2-8-5]